MGLVRPYCTVRDVQRETFEDAEALTPWFETCINRASRWVDEFCLRDFWFHDHSPGEGEDDPGNPPYRVPRKCVLGTKVFLPFPIIELTRLWVTDEVVDELTENDLVRDDAYFWEAELGVARGIIVSEEGSWGYYPFRRIMWLEGQFGYALALNSSGEPEPKLPPPGIPVAVRRSATLVAAALSAEKHVEQIGLDGARVELLDMSIPKDAIEMLTRYRPLANLI
jgi:hypothetical protein